jgi:hypothetical protein
MSHTNDITSVIKKIKEIYYNSENFSSNDKLELETFISNTDVSIDNIISLVSEFNTKARFIDTAIELNNLNINVDFFCSSTELQKIIDHTIIQRNIRKKEKIIEICKYIISNRLNQIKPAFPSNSFDEELDLEPDFISKRPKNS